MLARLQQTISALLILALLVCIWWVIARDPGWLGLAGAAIAIGGHSVVLGAEFLLVKLQSKHADPSHEPRWTDLARAWWAEALEAPKVFCWQQPFRSQKHPNHIPTEPDGRTGVLLIHGFFCNRGFWNAWVAELTAKGYPVVAVNLEPAFGSIDLYTTIIDTAVASLERSTGRQPIVVAHSMGGLALRAWLALVPQNGTRIRHAITLGSPHRGTALARLAFSANGRQMQTHSAWLSALADREATLQIRPPITCYYSLCDNIVFPAATATLPEADNRCLPATAHVHMASRAEPRARLLELLAEAERERNPAAGLSPRP